MIRAFRRQDQFWFTLVAAALLAAAHLFVIEYYAGLELARPLAIWFLLPPALSLKQRFGQLLKYSAPFTLGLLIFGSYRVFWMPRPFEGFDQNPPQMLFDLLEAPLATLISLVGIVLKDGVFILFSSWSEVFVSTRWDLTRPVDLVAIGIATLAAAALFHYIKRLRQSRPLNSSRYSAQRQMLMLGLSFAI